jgi:hypothetical protein
LLLCCLLAFPVGEASVLCPVCKSAHLAQRHGRLVCPAEGWQLNLAAESLTLDDVKGRLAAAYEVGGWACDAGNKEQHHSACGVLKLDMCMLHMH